MKEKLLITLIVLASIICLISIFPNPIRYAILTLKNAGGHVAAVILSHNFKTVAEIKSSHSDRTDNVRILIVPGHESDFGGTEFGVLLERDMAVELGQHLQNYLSQDSSNYEVFVTRDKDDWSAMFGLYFENNWEDIIAWSEAAKAEFSQLISVGSAVKAPAPLERNPAPVNVATRLYGINKWSNENDIDIVIHIHFNDYPRRRMNQPGKYAGFAIYVPESQYGNSTATRAIAKNIFDRLKKYNPISDLEAESVGIVDDSELIALGSNNTSDAASILIEYGYIYESQFQDPELIDPAIKDLAYQTYLGIEDFFGSSKQTNLSNIYDTAVLPHTWNISENNGPLDIFVLQTMLMREGLYPPEGKSKNDCPRTGILGPCTKESLANFQDKYGISGEENVIGENTISALKQLN